MNTTGRVNPAKRVGYVLKVFPRVSETFVINEIRAMENAGTPVETFSLHPSERAVPHRILSDMRRPVHYVDQSPVPDDAAVRHASHRLQRHFHVAPERRAMVLPRKYVRLSVQLAGLVREQRLTHLHAHFASRSGHVAALAAGLAGCTYSITAHAKDIYHDSVDRELLRWKIARARFVVTVTRYNLSYLRELVADLPGVEERVHRIYNGIDLERFEPAEPSKESPPLILGVGRLVEKKGFAVLIDACRLLRDRGRSFRCEIVGGGPLEAELRERIAAAGLSARVTLRGVLSTEAVGERLRAATVMTLPCVVGSDGNVDALPTVLLEAMASARPVVSTRLSGIPEIVKHEKTGLLVPPGDAPALAHALAAVLDRPAWGVELGRAGRERAERLFDLHRNVRRLRRLLKSDRVREAA